MRTFFLIMLLMISSALQSQERNQFSLGQITDSALKAFPPGRGRQLIETSYELKNSILRSSLMPSAILNAQASYQSDVTKLDIPMPGFQAPELAKDWYKVNVDLSQVVYDGGLVQAKMNNESADFLLQINKIEQAEEQLKTQVSDLFFGILMINNKIRILKVAISNLESMIAETTYKVERGILLKSELASLKSSLLRYRQQLTEAHASRDASLAMLSSLCHMTIDQSDSLVLPPYYPTKEYVIKRKDAAEYGLLHSRAEGLKMTEISKRRPTLGLFGQAGYGRPGYNMLDDSFDHYFMVGVRLQYKIWDWNTKKHSLQLIGLQQQQTKLAQENYNLQHQGKWKAMQEELRQYDELISLDLEIIQLQQSVVTTSQAQFNNGDITGSAFVVEFNKHHQAILELENHKIMQSKKAYEIMLFTGIQ
jgi:outer membrane protein TolC